MPTKFIAYIEQAVASAVLPRSLRSVADVRAARTEEKIGHSGRDDRNKKRGAIGNRSRPSPWGGRVSVRAPRNGEGAHPDAYSGDEVQWKPNETVGL
jgi:hypothetical protein